MVSSCEENLLILNKIKLYYEIHKYSTILLVNVIFASNLFTYIGITNNYSYYYLITILGFFIL